MRSKKSRFNTILLLLLSAYQPNLGLGSKVQWENFDWVILKTEHFNIHYPKGYDQLGKITAVYAEEANILISEKLDHTLIQVIPIFVYPSHGHFQGTNIIPLPIDEGTGGFTERIRRRIVLPYLGSYDDWRHVLTHELVHAFQYDIMFGEDLSVRGFLPGRAPLWFIEGMAEYISIGWDETAEMHIRDAIATETLSSLEDMSSLNISNGYILYKGGQSVMRFIDEVYGMYKIAEILHDSRHQLTFEDAIRTNLGISFEKFDEQWRLWYRRKYADLVKNEVVEEKSVNISNHVEDQSFLNLHPVISPDGTKVAYISIRDLLPAIVLRDADPFERGKNYNLESDDDPQFKEREETLLVQGGEDHEFYQLHLLDNRLSFTPDSKKLFFCVKSGGRDRLYLFDIEKEKVIQRWSPALDMIQYPRLSPDGTKALLVGTVLAQPDLYLLDLKTSTLTQLTFDLFSEKDPAFSGDNQFILFSGNRNSKGNFESSDYHIFEMAIKTKKISQMTFESGRQRSPMYYYDNSIRRIIYTSSQLGSPNLYVVDRDDKAHYQITNLAGGVFDPSVDRASKKIVFAAFRKQGYDIMIRPALGPPDDAEEVKKKPIRFNRPYYPSYGMSMADFVKEPYTTTFSVDLVFFSLFYTSGIGLAGLIYTSISDYMGDHNLSIYLDYLAGIKSSNIYFSYGYLKERIKLYVGAFKESSYFSLYRLSDINQFNNFLYNPYYLTKSYSNYGIYLSGLYPFTPFWSSTFRFTFSRYEETFFFKRSDTLTNINSLTASVQYNKVIYSIFGPLTGRYFNYAVEQSIDISGNDFVFNRQTLDYREYFNPFGRFVFVYRNYLETVQGPEARFFPRLIGGFGTLRGHPNYEYIGTNLLLLTLELRFPVLDALLMGFPVPWIFPGFSGVFFIDFGTIFYDFKDFQGYDPQEGRLKDLKLSFGLGGRFLIFAGVYIKIDWATPWDFKSILPIKRWRGQFSIGTEF